MKNYLPQLRIILAIVLATVSAVASRAEPLTWFAFADVAHQQGGAATRDQVLGASICCGAITSAEFADKNSTFGAIGIGARFTERLFSTISFGTSSSLHERYKIRTKPTAPPAFLTGDASNKRDSALLLLGYRFLEAGKFNAYAAGGIEYSRSKISTVNVATFIYPGTPFNRSLTVNEPSAAVEGGVGYELSSTFSVGAYARVFERDRRQFGARLMVSF